MLNLALLSCYCAASESSSALIAQGRKLQRTHVDKALSLYDRARRRAETTKDEAIAHYWMAQALAQKGNALAYRHYQRAIDVNPSYEHAYYSFGLALQRSRRLSEAASMYNGATRANPANTNALINVGICYKNLGR